MARVCSSGEAVTYLDRTDMMLRAMPGTVTEVMERTGVAKTTAKRWIGELRACGWVHVPKWKRPEAQGKIAPVFHAGPGKDAPRPPTRTAKQYVDKCRTKARKDGRQDFIAAKDRAAKAAARVIKRGVKASPFDVLFGERRN